MYRGKSGCKGVMANTDGPLGKHELASRLRQRLLAKGLVPKTALAQIDDDAVIWSYVTCSSCGVQSVADDELQEAVASARTVTEFFELTQKHACN